MTRYSKQERTDAIARLREWIKPGDTVYTILRHVSKSGMTRHIGIVLMRDGGAIHPNHAVAAALDMPLRRDAVSVGGCGMDMGFHIVYNLGMALWPNGTDTPHGTRNGEPDSCGGYALNHRWR